MAMLAPTPVVRGLEGLGVKLGIRESEIEKTKGEGEEKLSWLKSQKTKKRDKSKQNICRVE